MSHPFLSWEDLQQQNDLQPAAKPLLPSFPILFPFFGVRTQSFLSLIRSRKTSWTGGRVQVSYIFQMDDKPFFVST